MVTTKTADNALKSYYLPAVSDMLNTESHPFLSRIKQTTADVWGKDVRKLVRFGVNGGVGAGTEEGALPTPKGNNYLQLVSVLKNLYGTIEISDKAIRASASNEGAFVNLLNDEMEGLVKSANFNFSRMLFGNGDGLLGNVSSAADGFVFMDSVVSVVEGMVVDIYNTSGKCTVSGRTVLRVDRKAKKIKLEGATLSSAEAAAGFSVVLHGSKGLELTGLDAIMSNSETLYGITRGDYECMKPYLVTSAGEIGENVIQKVIDGVEEQSGSRINFILCSWGVKRALAEAFAEKSRNMDTMELKGGYTAMSFNGIPVVADRFCPSGVMYLLNTDDFALHQLCDWQWLEGEDGKVLKQVAGKPVYTATLVKYAELMCTRPCGQAKISGITEA